MKTKNILTLTITALIILPFASCNKPGNKTITPVGPQLATLFQQTQVQSQFFTVNAGSFSSITGTKGTKLFIYAGSLLHQNGSVVNGNVQIELKEIYSHGDMILSNATTTSDSFLLQSGGELYLAATQSGENLRIDRNNPISAFMPTTSGTALNGMQRFTGNFISNNNIAAGQQLNWNVVPGDTAAIPVIQDTMQGGGFALNYGIVLDSFGWSNCDRFYDLTGGTDPMIQLPTGYDNTNTSVYMIFDAENGVATADVWNSPIYKFHLGSHTPIGLHVTIVAIAKVGSNYFYAIQHDITATGAIFNLTMTQGTLTDINAAIEQL